MLDQSLDWKWLVCTTPLGVKEWVEFNCFYSSYQPLWRHIEISKYHKHFSTWFLKNMWKNSYCVFDHLLVFLLFAITNRQGRQNRRNSTDVWITRIDVCYDIIVFRKEEERGNPFICSSGKQHYSGNINYSAILLERGFWWLRGSGR